jgi:hypothetical protein
MRQCGIEIGVHKHRVMEILAANGHQANTTVDQLAATEQQSQQEYLATSRILSSDRKRFVKMIEDIENDFTGSKNPRTS